MAGRHPRRRRRSPGHLVRRPRGHGGRGVRAGGRAGRSGAAGPVRAGRRAAGPHGRCGGCRAGSPPRWSPPARSPPGAAGCAARRWWSPPGCWTCSAPPSSRPCWPTRRPTSASGTTWRPAASMIQKSARYFSFPGLGDTAGTSRSPSASTYVSRAWPSRTAAGRRAGRPGSLCPSGRLAIRPGQALCPGRWRGTAACPGRRPPGR